MNALTIAVASARANDLFRQVGPWLAMLVALVIVGWIALVWIRRRLRTDEPQDVAFTLDSLRKLRREGRLSDAEFEKARDAMVAAARRDLARHAAKQPAKPTRRR
ncbi:MAG: hypothetical protein U0575_12500 [Phycisphaerales bacterium]